MIETAESVLLPKSEPAVAQPAVVQPAVVQIKPRKSEGKILVIGETVLETERGTLRLCGPLDDRPLCKAAQWKSMSEAQRNECLEKATRRLESAFKEALEAAKASVLGYLEICAEEGVSPAWGRLKKRFEKGDLALDRYEDFLVKALEDGRNQIRKNRIAEEIRRTVNLSEYPDIFPARRIARKMIAVLGPTNSGKTHDAFVRLASAQSGVYLGPLRLLALEAFSRLNDEFGVKTSLLTGEEKRIVEGSRVTASTIEMLDPSRPVEVAVIDEIQLLSDPDRGWAWTQAVVGAHASEVWVLGALSSEAAIRALAKRLGMKIEVRYKTRKQPLRVGEPLGKAPRAALKKVRQGDALIVFSRRDALNLRDDLIQLGHSVACVYGALSPEVRAREAMRFANGDADILVATDAIGMGLNLPIRRVVFTCVQKYDGTAREDLPVPLLQQIAGRAGRYGHHEEDGVVAGLTPIEHGFIGASMEKAQKALPCRGFQITPGRLYLEAISKATSETRLAVLLTLFLRHAEAGDGFFVAHVPEDQMLRAEHLDRMPNLSLSMKHLLSMAPMSARDEQAQSTWVMWVHRANTGKPIDLDFIYEHPARASLATAEHMVRMLAVYRWFSFRLPELFVAGEDAEAHLPAWIQAVDAHLSSLRRQGQGGGGGVRPSWYWNYLPSY